MFSGVSALLLRSLREDALLLRYHLMRAGVVLSLILIAAVTYAQSTASAAPGRDLFWGLMWVNLFLVCLAGAGYFSTAIAEEKEEETLGLLLMAGVSRLGILLGKSTSRLIITLVMGLIELPFLMLAVTLGGVTRHQVVCGFAMVAGFTVLVANLGLLCSVLSSTTAQASRWMIGILLSLWLLPSVLVPLFVSIMTLGGTPGAGAQLVLEINRSIERISPWSQVQAIGVTGYSLSPMTFQVQSNLVLGGICFFLAWLSFDRFARDLSRSSPVRRVPLFGSSKGKSRRCAGDPFVWKDFYFLSGGWRWIVINMITLSVGMAVYSVYCFGTWSQAASVFDDDFLGPALFIMIFVSVFHLASIAGRFLSAETRDHTLPILFLTPNNGMRIVYAKLLGGLLGAIPTVGLTLVLFWGLVMEGRWEDELVKLISILVLFILVYLHLVTLMSLFLKWGAVPAAVGVMFAGSFCWGLSHYSVFNAMNGGDPLGVILLELLVLVGVLHASIGARVWVLVQK